MPRYFQTPNDGCLKVCNDCGLKASLDRWEGWIELDPLTLDTKPTGNCGHCGRPPVIYTVHTPTPERKLIVTECEGEVTVNPEATREDLHAALIHVVGNKRQGESHAVTVRHTSGPDEDVVYLESIGIRP